MAENMELLIALKADVAQLKAGLAQAESAIKGVDDSVKTAEGGMKKMMGTLKSVAGAMGAAFAGAQVANFAKESIMAASNLNEALSKVNVVFGENAKEIQSWASGATKNFGMSERSALTAVGTFGNLFDAFGLGSEDTKKFSKSLTELAVDMASFNDMSVDDALQALRSGLSGETEPMKKFGSVLSETRLKTEALSLGLIQNTTEALNPAAKAQAAYSLIMKDTARQQGDYQRTAGGTANTMRRVAAEMDNAKVAIGQGLLPIFDGLLKVLEKGVMPVLKKFGAFLKNNQDEIKAFGIVITLAATAWGVYTVAQKLATLSMQNFTKALKANAFGLIVTAIALVVAGLVKAYKNVDWFREAVNKAAAFALKAFAAIIPIIGRVYEAIAKIVTGPMRLFLTALSKLPGVGKYAKEGLEFINKGLDGISDFADKASKKANELAASLEKVNKEGDKTKKGVGKGDGKGGKDKAGDDFDVNDAKKAEAARKAAEKKEKDRLKAIEKQEKEAAKIIAKIEKVIQNEAEKLAKAAKVRDDKVADAKKRHAERVEGIEKSHLDRLSKAQKQYDDRVGDAQKRFQKTVEKAQKEYNKRVVELEKIKFERLAEAQQRYEEKTADARSKFSAAQASAKAKYSEQISSIEEKYNEKMRDLREKYENKVSDLQERAATRRLDAEEKAAEKRQDLVEKSMDRLRSAFASGLDFNIKTSFEKGGVKGLLDDLKKQLEGAKELQKNAAELAGKGYSQTFIEQVVKNGPVAGNEIAKALLEASPEATKELQALYSGMENISTTGLNDLAETMNAGGNLATAELRKAYEQVAVDLKNTMITIDAELQRGLNEANIEFQKAQTVATTERAKAMSEALSEMNKAIADARAELNRALAEAQEELLATQKEIQKEFLEGLADAQAELEEKLAEANEELLETLEELKKDFLDAQEEIHKDYLDALADAENDLTDQLLEIQKEYQESIDEIVADTKASLAELAGAMAQVVAQLNALAAAKSALAAAQSAAAAAAKSASNQNSTVLANSTTGNNPAAGNQNTNTNISVTNNINGSTDVNALSTGLVGTILYGVTIGTSARGME